MELKQFVKESLLQIIQGVKEAQAESEGTGAHINPIGMSIMRNDLKGKRFGPKDLTITETIEFDIAVMAMEGKEAKGGIGVVTGIFSLGGGGKTEVQTSNVSRLKFSVPVVLPSGKNFKANNQPATQGSRKVIDKGFTDRY